VLPRKDAWAKHPLCCDLPQLPREIRIREDREGKDSNCPIPSGKLPSRSELVKGLAEKRRLREDGGENVSWMKIAPFSAWLHGHQFRGVSIPKRSEKDFQYGMDVPCGAKLVHLSPLVFSTLHCRWKEKYKRTASSKFVEGRKPTLSDGQWRCQDATVKCSTIQCGFLYILARCGCNLSRAAFPMKTRENKKERLRVAEGCDSLFVSPEERVEANLFTLVGHMGRVCCWHHPEGRHLYSDSVV